MKKFVYTFIFMLFSISLFAKQDIKELQGSWYSDGIVYSFVNDSLYIDEIDNEGDVYIYSTKQNGNSIIISTTNDFGDEFSFQLIKVSSTKIKIKFKNEKPFVLNKVYNYDVENMKFKNTYTNVH